MALTRTQPLPRTEDTVAVPACSRSVCVLVTDTLDIDASQEPGVGSLLTGRASTPTEGVRPDITNIPEGEAY